MKKSYLCACCLKKGCNNLKRLDEEPENYGELIKNTFRRNETINYSRRFFCEVCIARLLDAAAFLQQVTDAGIILETLRKENLEVHVKIDDNVDGSSCEDWQSDPKSEDELSVKIEPITPKTVDSTGESDYEDKMKDVMGINKHKTEKLPCKMTEKRKHSGKHLKKKATTENEDKKDQRENSIKLITNSNICLFKSLRTRFACYVCNEKYFEMKDLRIHSKIHSTDDFKRRIKRLRGKSYENADITNLSCNICSENCNNLDVLRKHLNKNHNIVFGDSNLLIPYKLEEGLQCQICQVTFNTFTSLSIHMNSHATSNVCETCGMAFYNRMSLRNHIRSIHKEQKCSQCSLKFPSSTKLVKHKRKSHNGAHAKHYCLKCNMTFRYTYLLKNHMVEKHGGKVISVECSSCDKVFKDQNSMKTHFRSVHLNERNFSCSLCELRFFTKTGKARHEKIHLGGILITCDLCETKFKSKDSLRRHMKRQHMVVVRNDDNKVMKHFQVFLIFALSCSELFCPLSQVVFLQSCTYARETKQNV